MGRCSTMAMGSWADDRGDDGYPSPERQLLWRLEELLDRLDTLIARGAAYPDGYVYREEDIRYAPPERLNDISKVKRAIAMAKEDLLGEYGIAVDEAGQTLAAQESDDADGGERMTLGDQIASAVVSRRESAA